MKINYDIFVLLLLAVATKGLYLYSYGTVFQEIVEEFKQDVVVASDKTTTRQNWIEQPLNHFDTNDNRTWRMRYFERHDLWKENKPIYLFLGGEGSISPAFLKTGIMYELARETGGALYIGEHRYYGKSKPFDEYTAENLKYLSSRQALADFARLLETIKESEVFKSSKVVLVGGSYSANLAAWMKLLYPNLVDTVISSSGPVLAKANFYEYLDTVSDDFLHYGNPGCWDNIAVKFRRYQTLFENNDGVETLKNEENICHDCDMCISERKQLFFLSKVSEFMYIAQYGNTRAIKRYCESNFAYEFRNSKKITSTLNKRNECYCYDFDEMIDYVRKIDWYTAWMYQTCTEFGYYQTTASNNHPFTDNVPVEFFYKMCTVLFGPEFDGTRVERGVEDVNRMYGGIKPNVSRVVFVNGELDPWSKLGVLEDISYEAPAKMVGRASHCRDLFSDRDGDPEELKEARRYIKYIIRNWTGEGQYRKSEMTSLGHNNATNLNEQ